MLLRESPFSSRALVALDGLASGLLAPSFWVVNRLLDLQQTTAERRRQRQRRCGSCRSCTGQALAGLAYSTLLLLSLPLAALGLLLWLPVQAARRPFAYQYTAGTAPAEPWDLRQRRSFTFISANVCLLPSGLAKFSNLGQTPQRATYIARHLALAPPDPPSAQASLVEPRHGETNSYGGTLDTPWQPPGSVPAAAAEPVPAVLSERFPADADFICLQEVFEAGAAACLRRWLGGTFPHIISEVGARGLWGGQLKVLNSGLFLASRYPLLAVRYHGFPNGAREDALAAKGLLVVQVSWGPPPLPFPQPCGSRQGAACSRRISPLRVPRPPRCCWARRRGRGSWATSAAPTCRHPQVRRETMGGATLQPTAAEAGCRCCRCRAVTPCVCVCVCVPPPPPLTGDAAIRDAQLTLGLRWLQQFREAQEQRGDVVAFDVFCGDLNFDNCSRGGDGAGRGGAGGFWWGVMAETCLPSPQGTSSTRGTGSSRCTRTPAAGSPGRTHPGP